MVDEEPLCGSATYKSLFIYYGYLYEEQEDASFIRCVLNKTQTISYKLHRKTCLIEEQGLGAVLSG